MAEQPYLKFFHRDWLADSALRMCSRAARGLWIDMLALMADAAEFGILPFGLDDAPEALSNACGGSPKEIESLLRELARRGVYSIREDGSIYSRRLVRDHVRFVAMSKLGKNGAESRYSGNANHAIAKNSNPAIAENAESAIAENAESAIAENEESGIAENEESGIAHIYTEAQKLRISETERNGGGETAVSPGTRVRPKVPEVPVGAFGSLEADVARFIALAAAENSTGKISLGRIQSLRRALLAARDEFPHAFSAALREANLRGKPSVNYLRAIAKNHELPQRSTPTPLASGDEPMPDYLIAAAALHDRDFGAAGGAA